MKNPILFIALVGILFCACKKNTETLSANKLGSVVNSPFTRYKIAKGEQSCDLNIFTPTEYEKLNFRVKFDSSAIYRTRDPLNQYDINKLYGFADNSAHHQEFSARIGWRYSDDSLRLFAYVYNNSQRASQEICSVVPGIILTCSISVYSHNYLFSVNENQVTMSRLSAQSKAVGYKLYPYFGGNEMAPHDISIWIKEF